MTLRSFAVAISFGATATIARGQCVLVTDKPPDLRGAQITISRIADDGQGARVSEKPDHFKHTLTLLYEHTANVDNQIGRQYLLGRLYAVWLYLNLPGTKTITTRKELELFGGDAKRQHDLYMAMDSAFAKVEAENPACVDSTSKYRAAVSKMAYDGAREMLEAKKYDSAVVLAKRALVADPKGAAPWNLLAEANKQRNDTVGFRQALRKVSMAPGSDPITKKARAQAYLNLAVMALNDAANLQGESQKRLAEQAESDIREMLKLQPGDIAGQTALTRALNIKGDSVAAKAQMTEMMKEPEKYSAGVLSEMASAQYNSGEYASAVKLYEIMLSKNPMLADGISSYISALLKTEPFESAKAVAAARKLISVDPNSQRSLSQAAAAWQKTMLTAKESDPIQKPAQDSTLYYVTESREQKVVFVRVNDFKPGTDAAVIDGQVNNMGEATKSYTVEFEFLNATGGVVSSATANVPNVQAKNGAAFTVRATGAGIVAWRYKPLRG
jgi:tetratricopeptide (TPR) repeat protein